MPCMLDQVKLMLCLAQAVKSSAVQSAPPVGLTSLDPAQTLSSGAFLAGLPQLTSYNLSATALRGLQQTLAWQWTWLIYLRGPLLRQKRCTVQVKDVTIQAFIWNEQMRNLTEPRICLSYLLV